MRAVQAINHAQFVDDTNLLGCALTQISRRFKITLDLFLNVSGRQINSANSWLYGWKNNPLTLWEIVVIMGIKVNLQWTSFIYVGVPIVNRKCKALDWSPLIQKLKNRIQDWSTIWLNLVGKVVLIKSILSSYPTFSCTIFLAPKSVINVLSIEIGKFLWQGGKTGEKFNVENLDTVLEDCY